MVHRRCSTTIELVGLWFLEHVLMSICVAISHRTCCSRVLWALHTLYNTSWKAYCLVRCVSLGYLVHKSNAFSNFCYTYGVFEFWNAINETNIRHLVSWWMSVRFWHVSKMLSSKGPSYFEIYEKPIGVVYCWGTSVASTKTLLNATSHTHNKTSVWIIRSSNWSLERSSDRSIKRSIKKSIKKPMRWSSDRSRETEREDHEHDHHHHHHHHHDHHHHRHHTQHHNHHHHHP